MISILENRKALHLDFCCMSIRRSRAHHTLNTNDSQLDFY